MYFPPFRENLILTTIPLTGSSFLRMCFQEQAVDCCSPWVFVCVCDFVHVCVCVIVDEVIGCGELMRC